MRLPEVVAGALLTVCVHGLVGASAYYYERLAPTGPKVASQASKRPAWGLCGKRRCAHREAHRRRRKPEPPPFDELEILEATLIPRLGLKEADPTTLPKLETYEQPEILEHVVNPYVPPEPKPPENVKQAFDPEPAKRDPRNKKKLADLFAEPDDDPRKRATRLEDIVGHKEGDVAGSATVLREGNLYARKAWRRLRKDFIVPPFLDRATLSELRLRVKVTKMSPDGAIKAYRVLRKSGNRAFDNAAVAALQRYVPAEGGKKRLPEPDGAVLHHINTKGLTITFDGRLMQF